MTLFTQSLKTYQAACQEVADSVGASADTERTTRAGRSLNAALTYFNGKANWEFLLSESGPVSVLAPFAVPITASAAQTSATVLASHGVKVDDFIVGSGFSQGMRVSATAATTIGFNGTITGYGAGLQNATVSANRDMYDLPADWKMPYTVRLLGSNRTLSLHRRRAWDRVIVNESTISTPLWYDIFPIGAKGKLRLLPPPAQTDVLLQRYYRRMTIPTATADTTALDIPQDYEAYLVAWGKWHFLTDVGEGRADQATVWLSLANEGLQTMLRDQTRIPDENLGFTPGHYMGTWDVNSTRLMNWEY